MVVQQRREVQQAGFSGEQDVVGYVGRREGGQERLAAPFVDLAQQRQFFHAHIEPWAGRFFGDLEAASAARLYAPIGRLGRLFVEIETLGFDIDA